MALINRFKEREGLIEGEYSDEEKTCKIKSSDFIYLTRFMSIKVANMCYLTESMQYLPSNAFKIELKTKNRVRKSSCIKGYFYLTPWNSLKYLKLATLNIQTRE